MIQEHEKEKTIVMFFRDHPPVRFTGKGVALAIQVMNAEAWPDFVSWDFVPTGGS